MWRTLWITLCLGVFATSAWAQTAPTPPPSADEVNRVARQLYCPVCENVPLDVCPTQACADWRADIREKLALGWTDQQIKDYFATQHGDRVLATPPALVYLLPPVMFLVGGFMVYRFLQGRRTPPVLNTPAAPLDPYHARLEDELKKRQ